MAVQQPVGTELFKVEIVNAKIAGTSFTQGNTSGEVRVSVNNKLVGSGSGSVGIEETTNTVKLDVTVKDDAWAALAAVKANVTILGKAGVTTTNRLDVEVKRGSDGKLLFSQQLALVGDDAGKQLGFALKQFCDGAQDISASANIDVVKQTADVAASVQVAGDFIFSGSTAVAVVDGKTCSVKANIVGNRPGRIDGNPAGAVLSTADQCLQVQKCYEADVWSDSSNAFCQQLVKGVPLQWDYAFSRGYPYYNCYRYEVANKAQFQTAMNTRYGTSGCRFRVVRVASV
jgi:hypothetical protein